MSATPSMRRRRQSSLQPTLLRRKRQTAVSFVPFMWSLRAGIGSTDTALCGDVVDSSPSNPELCSSDMPQACSVGDLMAKHGPLNIPQDGTMLRMVFTDANLPLSGPLSPFSSASSTPLLMFQRIGGNDGEATCTGVVPVSSPTTSPTTPPTTPSVSDIPKS